MFTRVNYVLQWSSVMELLGAVHWNRGHVCDSEAAATWLTRLRFRRMVELGCGGRFCIKQAEALRKHEGSNLLTATYSGQAWEQASHFGPLLLLCCCCIAIKKCKRQQGSKYVMESSQLVSPSRFSVLNLANCVGFKALSTLSWICVAVPILYTCQAHSVEDMW